MTAVVFVVTEAMAVGESVVVVWAMFDLELDVKSDINITASGTDASKYFPQIILKSTQHLNYIATYLKHLTRLNAKNADNFQMYQRVGIVR